MEQQGILFESERALDIFRENGFYIEGKIVHCKEDDVRKAYKKMVLQYHPDRVSHLGEEVKNAATKKMQEINKAKDAIFTARGMK